MSKKNIIVVCLVILLLAGGITATIFLTEPEAKKVSATKKTAMLVQVERAESGDFHPQIAATGTVQPARDIVLNPRVSGQVLDIDQQFTPGGILSEGEAILQIDPADYRNTLALRKSQLKQAQTDLQLELGRQNVAQQDYKSLNDTAGLSTNKALILRKPQLEAAQASVGAAKASVRQARLDLSRTTVRAPFNALVLRRNANVGSQVATGDNMGRLVGIDRYWVELTMPLRKMPWLSFPREGEKGAKVMISCPSAWDEGEQRTAYLFKKNGALNNQTRMARVMAEVQDPLGYHRDSVNVPELIIGSFIQARIKGREITDVVRLKRDYLRKSETVWVMKDDKLDIRKLDIVLKDHKYAYIRKGLSEGEKVVTTNLSTVSQGAALRTEKVTNAKE